jgi:hypothetical protein
VLQGNGRRLFGSTEVAHPAGLNRANCHFGRVVGIVLSSKDPADFRQFRDIRRNAAQPSSKESMRLRGSKKNRRLRIQHRGLW